MRYILLEECCEILDSMRIPITAKDRTVGSFPYYGANGVQDYVGGYLFDDELVLLAEDGGNFGSKDKPIAYRVSGKCWVNNHAHVLKPKAIIDVDYLCFSLMFYNTDGLVNGATRQKLTQSAMRKMKIPYVPIEVQIAIVKKIKIIQSIIIKRQQELDKLDELVKARFVEMFGSPFDTTEWTVKNLKDISESMIDGSNVNPNYYEAEGEVLFLRIQNVWRNEFRLDDSVYITQEINHKYYYDTSLKTGDLLITKIGRYYTIDSSLGRVSVYRGEDDSANYSNNIMRVRLNNSMNSEFVNVLLNLDDYQSFIKRTSKGGTDKRALSKSLIGSYPIIIPPIELQNKFADFVKQIDKSKVAVQKALDEAQLLFDSLMQEYFG